MKIFSKIHNMLFYCGLSKENFRNVKSLVSTDNGKTVNFCSLIAFAAFIIVVANSIIQKNSIPVILQLIPSAVFFLIFIINKFFSKKLPVISDIFAVLFVIVLLAAGVYIGVSQSDARTTTLLPCFVFASTLFSFRIIYLVIVMTGTEIVYLALINCTQTGELLQVNTVNTAIFCAVGLCVGIIMMRMKYGKHEADYFNKYLLGHDTLTSLYNRRSYENELEEITDKKTAVTVCVFDINGLKVCNDTKGHKAGDELIIGAAECISESFGKYGKVFRIGGDEFSAILRGEVPDAEQLHKNLSDITGKWRGEFTESLNISCGIVRVGGGNSKEKISEALQKADSLMYEEKREYHKIHNK